MTIPLLTTHSTDCPPDWNITTLEDLGQYLNQDIGAHLHVGHPAQVEIDAWEMPHQSCSVSFTRDTLTHNRRNNRSPPQRINVNIVTTGCVVSQPPHRSRSPPPQRPYSPTPYSPPYHPFSTPSPSVSRTVTLSHPSASSTPDANASTESVV